MSTEKLSTEAILQVIRGNISHAVTKRAGAELAALLDLCSKSEYAITELLADKKKLQAENEKLRGQLTWAISVIDNDSGAFDSDPKFCGCINNNYEHDTGCPMREAIKSQGE